MLAWSTVSLAAKGASIQDNRSRWSGWRKGAETVAARQNAVDGSLYELGIEEGERQMFSNPAFCLPVTYCDRLYSCGTGRS
jgi:hypothetical protein